MVKLEAIRTAVLAVPQKMLNWCEACDKGRVVPVAHDQVGGEQAAEEHDFREQEEPHGEVGGVKLLVDGLEVMALIGRMLS